MEKRRPAYRHIERKFDISSLIPGDRIHVMLNPDKGPEIMVYAGRNTPALNSNTKCYFIKIPDGYHGEDLDSIFLWESYVKYLQFDGRIDFNHLYMDLRVVQSGTEEYKSAKTLLDLLI